MVTELRDLLHDAADSPRSEAVDTDVLLSQAKQRVARRRRSGIASACVAVASVALVAAVLTRTDTVERPEPPTNPIPAPSAKSELLKAPTAVQGEDYRVVTSYELMSLHSSDGRLVEAITPAGLLVYRDGPDGGSNATELGLLDPGTGETTVLPAELASIGANRIITSRTMIAGASYGVSTASVWYYDTATRAWGTFSLDDIAAGGIQGIDPADAVTRIQFGTESPDELFLSIGTPNADKPRDRLVSVSLGGSGLDPVDRGNVSLWSMSGDTLAYVPASGIDGRSVTLRDLSADTEDDVTIPGRGNCAVAQMWLRSDRLIMRQDCQARAGGEYDLLQVFDVKGELIQRLRSPAFTVLYGAHNRMLLKSQDPPGLFLYDLETGKAMRLTNGLSQFQDLGAAEGQLVVFGSPIQGGRGLRVWIADFS